MTNITRATLALLCGLCAVPAVAQTPCDAREVKGYIAGVGGTRTAPPVEWKACLGSLRADPLGAHKEAILQALATLRVRRGMARDPGEEEKRLFQGAGRAVIVRELLDGWRINLGVRRAEERFDSPFYQAFLAALSWIVLDRSEGLDAVCVAPLVRLKSALGRGPSWRDVEGALLSFDTLPLWKDVARDDLSLTRLRDQVAGLAPAALRRACPAVSALPMGGGYWPAIAKELGQIKPALRVEVPPSCRLAACGAAGEWGRSPGGDSWKRVLKTCDDDVTSLERRFTAARGALPAGIAWQNADDRLKSLRQNLSRIQQAHEADGSDAVQEVGPVLKDLEGMTAVAGRLEDIVVSAEVLDRLLSDDLVKANSILDTKKIGKDTAAPLIATYVIARYWERGPDGSHSACKEVGGCSRQAVSQELERVGGILGLSKQDLGALE